MTEHSSLEEFIQNVCSESHLRIEDDLGDGFVRLRSEEAERRQALQDIRCNEDILVEMLRNARDAGATRIYVSLGGRASKRSICMIDNGCGIPSHMHSLVFEPRVTSKLDTMHMDAWGVHGRGMALYSIYHNADQARIVFSAPGMGTSILVETDKSRLREKTDQSTFPLFHMEENTVKVLGPKNLLRTACEFALESRHSCTVVLGSTTEIAAALYEDGLGSLSAEDRLFAETLDDIPVCNRLALSSDPDSFAEAASSLGLELSSRSARRIMNGEIKAPLSLIDRISGILSKQQAPDDGKLDQEALDEGFGKVFLQARKSLVIADEDKEAFGESITQAYRLLAASYYLDPEVQPELSCGKNGIRIFIPFKPMD